jgi:hypothetical protein
MFSAENQPFFTWSIRFAAPWTCRPRATTPLPAPSHATLLTHPVSTSRLNEVNFQSLISYASFKNLIEFYWQQLLVVPYGKAVSTFSKYRISRPIRRTFFSRKCDLNLTWSCSDCQLLWRIFVFYISPCTSMPARYLGPSMLLGFEVQLLPRTEVRTVHRCQQHVPK